ncbi:MAG: anthranilate synthase component I [Firmicutes bacterium]|nr:anthranilate synthase component I [Bacillota bacterium]
MNLSVFPDKEEFIRLSSQGNLIPVFVVMSGDMETPVSMLARMKDHSGSAFLLESVEGGERWGRYSFLGNSAFCEVKVYRDGLTCLKNGAIKWYPHEGDPLRLLRKMMRRFKPVDVDGLPPFRGGAVGYMAYEMVSFFEKIPNNLPADAAIAHFMITDSFVVFDNLKHTMTAAVYAHIDDGNDPSVAYDNAAEKLERMMRDIMLPHNYGYGAEGSMSGNSPLKLEPVVTKQRFCSMVEKTIEHIGAGDIIQAVISQPFRCNHKTDPFQLYRALRFINPSPYMFFLKLGNDHLVGSSPETMIKLENGTASLRPIAGTRPRGKDASQDRQLAEELLADEKERAEHVMLVDLGRNDLGRVAEAGSVEVTDFMTVEKYSHVMHIVSNVSCRLKEGADAWELFKSVFPAGTLSGAPKVRAMEIISDLEEFPRGVYGGAVGYVSFDGNMDFAITIRTAHINETDLVVQAGAGIVADSDPEKEYQETINKAAAMQRALEMLENRLSPPVPANK